jgi:acyl-CoA reductase-like NAD-dependent aldehyde dehydrogenase
MNPFDLKQLGLDVEYPYRQQYDNYIGGKWVPPVKGEYFENVSPINGKPFCRVPRSSADDIEVALDAAHAARRKWGKTSVAERANLLLAAADRMEKNLKLLAVAETIDNGKPLRETMPTCRSRSTTSAISRAASARRKAAFPRSTTTRLRITSTSRSASSARSSRGTSRC